MAICGVIANCDDWPDIALFAQQRETWFKRFLKLPYGVPSHDTFERVFAALDSRAFEYLCLVWLRDVSQVVGAGHIAIDGKTLRGSAGSPLGALHLVSTWATSRPASTNAGATTCKVKSLRWRNGMDWTVTSVCNSMIPTRYACWTRISAS